MFAHFVDLLTHKFHSSIDIAVKRAFLNFVNPCVNLFQGSWSTGIKLIFIEGLQSFKCNIDIAFNNGQLLFVVHDFTLEYFDQLLVFCETMGLKQ